jgi:hypothetical protein
MSGIHGGKETHSGCQQRVVGEMTVIEPSGGLTPAYVGLNSNNPGDARVLKAKADVYKASPEREKEVELKMKLFWDNRIKQEL